MGIEESGRSVTKRSAISWEARLRGAYDLHVHAAPDVVPRAQDLFELAHDAHRAGMAGIVLKDHVTSTVGAAYVLNRMRPNGPRFYSSLVLNPPVGSLNPAAVEAALRAGAAFIFFPTYGARHHVKILGLGAPPGDFPLPKGEFAGVTIWNDGGELRDEVMTILELIAENDAVLATGHLSPEESLALLAAASRCGVRRKIVTHASEIVPGMTVGQQRQAAELGAKIEHCFLVVTSCCPGTIPLETLADQIREVGVEHVVLSSDFGQVANGPPVTAFAEKLDRLVRLGINEEQVRVMVVDNPRSLIERRRATRPKDESPAEELNR